jgi:hypothetical protein
LVVFYFFLIFWKTLKEKEAMEEPETLFKHSMFSLYTFFLIFLFCLTYFIDTIGQ